MLRLTKEPQEELNREKLKDGGLSLAELLGAASQRRKPIGKKSRIELGP